MDHTHAPFMQRLADAVQATGVTDAQLDLLAGSETLMTEWVGLLAALTEHDAAPIHTLKLDPHVTDILKWAGIRTIWQLRQRRAAELRALPGIGAAATRQMIAKLEQLGLSLCPDPEDEPPAKTTVTVPLPDKPNRAGTRRLLERVFQDEYDRADRVEYYAANLVAFKRLLSHLSERRIAIVVVRFGLHDGVIRTHAEAGDVLGLTAQYLGQVVSEAAGRMLGSDRAIRHHAETAQLTEQTPLDELELSERPDECLRRAGITTLETLCTRTSDDLLAITNFGQESLDEVIAKLDARGLALQE